MTQTVYNCTTTLKNLRMCDLFAHFEQQPWSMFLDSANADHPCSRFDMIVASPVATITVKNQQTIVCDQGQEEVSEHPAPLDRLQALIDKYQHLNVPVNSSIELPVTTGAFGYLAYDFGRRLEKLPSLTAQDISMPDLAFGIYEWSLIRDNQTGQTYLCCQNEMQKTALLKKLTQPHLQNQDFSIGDWQANMTEAEYQTRFNQVQDYLHSGDCYQINLAQRFSTDFSGSEWQAYQILRAHNQAPFSAYIRLEEGCILSVSPERFVQVFGQDVETKPIKGTRPRFAEKEADQRSAQQLAYSAKDQAENVMIVDLLRNDLGRVCQPGTVKVPALFEIESFPSVHHLVSTVTGKLGSDKQTTDLLHAAFPGGSITGAPKIRAMEIIESLEPHHRSIYCGSIGYLGFNGHMDTSITIRTLVCHKQQIHCWAGGGIVADSQSASEYQETFDKVRKILPVLKQTGKMSNVS